MKNKLFKNLGKMITKRVIVIKNENNSYCKNSQMKHHDMRLSMKILQKEYGSFSHILMSL